MSIEALLTRVAEALEANTEAMKAMTGSAAKSTGSKSTSTKSESKPASKPAASKTTKKKGATTAEDVAERVGNYLKTGTKAEREERKAHVKAIIDHYEVERFTGIDAEQYDEALGYLDAFENGEDPFAGDGADEEEGDEDGALV